MQRRRIKKSYNLAFRLRCLLRCSSHENISISNRTANQIAFWSFISSNEINSVIMLFRVCKQNNLIRNFTLWFFSVFNGNRFLKHAAYFHLYPSKNNYMNVWIIIIIFTKAENSWNNGYTLSEKYEVTIMDSFVVANLIIIHSHGY